MVNAYLPEQKYFRDRFFGLCCWPKTHRHFQAERKQVRLLSIRLISLEVVDLLVINFQKIFQRSAVHYDSTLGALRWRHQRSRLGQHFDARFVVYYEITWFVFDRCAEKILACSSATPYSRTFRGNLVLCVFRIDVKPTLQLILKIVFQFLEQLKCIRSYIFVKKTKPTLFSTSVVYTCEGKLFSINTQCLELVIRITYFHHCETIGEEYFF